jgi:hypothetical protein
MTRLRLLLVFGCAVLAAGCVPIRKGDCTYYVIIGAGMVGVRQTNDVTVVKSTALGLYTGDGRTALGVASVYSARVPTNSEIILEVTR